jgi:autotransporter-associated beta strand protein
MEGFVGLGCNARAVSQQRRLGQLRGSASHAVLVLAAAVVLSGAALADVNSGQSVNISGAGSKQTLNGGTIVIDGSSSYGTDLSFNDVAGNTIDLKGATATLSGVLSGAGGITFSNSTPGTGVLTLSNSGNSFTGAATIATGTTVALKDTGTLSTAKSLTVNGTFDISATTGGAAITSLAGSGSIVTGTLPLSISAALEGANFSGVISGSGAVYLASGTQTFSGINTYTGATTVSAGTLTLASTGSIAQSSAVVIYGTLDASAATANLTREMKSLSGSGTVTLGNNDLSLTAASGSFTGALTTTGKLVLNGGTQYIGGASNTFGQGIDINTGTLQLGGATTDVTIAYNINNKDTLTYYNTYGLTMSGVVSGTGTVNKWGSGIATVTSAQAYTGATVISGGTLKLTGAGSIANSSGVQVDAIFDLTESSAVAVKALSGIGSVRLGDKVLTITNGTGDFSGTISGSGTLTITGGSQSLSGTNTYTGATNINGGKLILVAGSSLKSAVALQGGNLELTKSVTAPGNVTVNSLKSSDASSTVALAANTLVLAAANDTFAGTINGTGGLTITGGTETLSGASTYTGTTTVSAGKLILTGTLASTSKLNISGTFDATGAAAPTLTFVSLAGSGAVQMGAHGLVLNSAANSSTTFSGVISGSGGLRISGQGTQVLSGTNTFTGGTTVDSGASLQIGNGNNTGSIDGGILNNGTVRFYRLDTTKITGAISGSGALVQAGIGTTVLTADNTYTGGTTISAGTLQIGDYDPTKAGSGLSGSILGNVEVNGTLAFARAGFVSISAEVSGAGNLAVNSGTIALTAASTYSGITRIASGAELQLAGTGSIAQSSLVTADGRFDISGTASGASIVSLSGGGNVVLGGKTLTLSDAADTFAGKINGTGGLIIAGGSETLSGDSSATFSGATTVQAGTLAVTGSIANSAVTVKSGGMVTGNGAIGGLTVENGGTVKAGLGGSGTLTVTGPLSLVAGSTYAVDVTSAGAAKLAVNGVADIHGALAITSANGTYNLGNTVTILTASGGVTGTFSTAAVDLVTGTNGAVYASKVDYTANAVTLKVSLAQLSTALAATATTNQKAVAGAIDKAIAAKSAVPAGFEALGNRSKADLLTDTAALAGEIGADTPRAAKAMFSPFLDSMAQRTAMLRPLGKGETRPFETWISAYGGTDTVAGDAGIGTHKFRSNVDGVVAGAQWAPWANTLIGAAVGFGTSDFHIASDLGKGSATSLEAGVYGYMQASRHIYNSFALGVSGTRIKTTRALAVSGNDTLEGKVTSYTFGGRYEAGLQLSLFTPYVAVQDYMTMLPGYTEDATAGSATYALKYDSRTVNSGRAEVGLRHFIDVEVTPRWILTPDFTLRLNDRLAYAYDLSDGPKAGAMFASLPSSGFDVFGAKQRRHAGLATLGADVLFNNGLRITANVEAAVTQKSESFTGFAGLGYTW